MSIPFLLLGAVLLSAPLYTQAMLRAEWDAEKAQIQVDNAGITLGRADRKTLNSLVASNRVIRQLEISHHTVHACARVPSPAQEGCIAMDEAMEKALLARSLSAGAKAHLDWVRGSLTARKMLREGEGTVTHSPLHIGRVSCGICQLKLEWEIEPKLGSTQVLLKKGTGVFAVWVEMRGDSLREKTPWNYRLRAR